ncbi:hypothetical protein PP175_07945 [Aneurinibacillus sp. Ricciae_BoGa-3]|uniref:hypothetical protein n=1 Tax=Aneurinibacillus sp. Ricciae_BoGa-3 TaxID=3022697 RepID=UPI002340B81C|nr:hypothetical protein [Aneurinibacillus sp. Ricciae_BoGa-3]WCK55846.1 hypothetical protein PP175_07945 [Aneurinibacillus sp. Ricciae_BoGa-3]
MEGLTYTPPSMLKKVFREGERSLSRQELQDRLQNTYGTRLEAMNVTAEHVIDRAVEDGTSPFHEGSSHAVIEMERIPRDHIAEEMVRYFLENKAPLTEDQCLKKLRRLNLISYSFPASKLPLHKDPRFVQLEGSDLWYLARWSPANDKLYDFIVARQLKQFPLAQLYMIMEHELGMSRREFVFVPEGDERFRVIEGLVIVSYTEEEMQSIEAAAVSAEEQHLLPIKSHEEEVAVTMANDVKTASVFEDTLRNAQDSVEKLQTRIKEMEEEVLDQFKVNNLAAISQLVGEKEKCESIVRALENVMGLVNNG